MTDKQRIQMLKDNLDSSLTKLRKGEMTHEQYKILAQDVNKRIKEIKKESKV